MTNEKVVNEKLTSILKSYKRFGTGLAGERIDLMEAHDQIIELFRECLPEKKNVLGFEINYKTSREDASFNQAITEAEKKIGGV